jgi:hypothetical protein
MSHSRPTLDELRVAAQKGRHREIGNFLARRLARPSAVYGTWLAVRLGLSANQVTCAALAASLSGAAGIGSGTRWGFVLGVTGLHIGFWLDHVDGQVARWRRTAGLNGVYLDYIMHHLANLALGFALGFGLAIRTGDPVWSVAGFSVAAGWALLSLHNDCRYKAFFQRLKSTTGSYRVDGGSGGRPAPPAAWPRRGLAALTWPAYKLCEPHVCLITLTLLAFLACLEPAVWALSWRLLVIVLSFLAPTLGAGRVARAVSRGATETEFARWFQPDTKRRDFDLSSPQTGHRA